MNKNGFQTLYCSGDGYAEIPWTRPAGNRFSIMVHFLPESLPKDGTLFSLSGLAVGFVRVNGSAGYIQLRGKAFYRNSECCAILPQCKNTLLAIVDGREVKIYGNGILAIEMTLNYNPGSTPGIRIGENLSAVGIFDVTIFHRLLNSSEIQQYCVKKPENFASRILFSEDTAPAGVTLHQCKIENCVYTLDCRVGGFCLPNAKLPKKYTISFSLYHFDENRSDGMLFRTPDIQVKIFYETGCTAPQLIIHQTAGPEFNVPRSFKLNQWINITFVFDGSRYYIYFDKTLVTAIDGNSSDMQAEDIVFGPFDGYMDTCTIVKYAVSETQITDFLENPPGIFSNDLLYLCDFSGKELLESRCNKELTPHGAKIVLARGTGALTNVKKKIAPPANTRPYSEFVNWEIGVLLQLLVAWIHEQFGIYPNKGNIIMDKEPWEVEIGLRQFIHKEILSMPEAQELFIDYDCITHEKLLNLIQAMEKNGTLKKLMEYLYQNDDLDKLYEFIRELLKVAMIAAIILAIKTMLENIKSCPPPKRPSQPDLDDDDDDDDDKKKKKTDIRIKQISLKGDMDILAGGSLRMSADGADAENEPKNRAVFFLRNETGNHTLTVTLTFKGDKDDFTVFAENKKGQVIAGIRQSVSCTGSNSVKVSCPVHLKHFHGKYGKCKETLRWSCRSKDGKQSQLLEETDFELYFLEGKPCGPWENTVPIECLELCAACAEHAGTHSEGFFADYMNYISDKATKQELAAPAPARKSFSRIHPKKDKPSVFYARKFCAAWIHGELRISRNDWIYSAPVFTYLNGNDSVGTIGLCSGITWGEEDNSKDGARLLLKKADNPDEYFCPEDYVYSVVAITRGNSESPLIYDSRRGVNGLPFSADPSSPVTGEHDPRYYREGNFVCGSYCQQFFTLVKNNWLIDDGSPDDCLTGEEIDADSAENLAEGLTVGLVRPGPDGRYAHEGRTGIDPEVRGNIPRPAREDVDFNAACHSISAYQIDCIIADICNTILQQRHDAAFQTLIDALCPELPPGDDPALANFIALANHRRNLIEHLARTLERRLGNGNQDEITNNLVLHFSYLAGNSPANLRMGRGDWNSSIGSNFDPAAWFFFTHENGECVMSNAAFDEACERGALLGTLMGRYPGIPVIPRNQLGYYLADKNDGIRIAKLREMGYRVDIICKLIEEQNPGGGYNIYLLLASSGNYFPHERAGGGRDRYIAPPANLPIPIFYISTDEHGQRVWVRLE